MTKEEAIILMQQGKRMTHPNFTIDEWVYIGIDGRYVLEDGVECSGYEFWRWRSDDFWNNEWTIWKKQSN